MKVWLIKKIITSLSCAMALLLVAPSAFAYGWARDPYNFKHRGLSCQLRRYEGPMHIYAERSTTAGNISKIFFVYAETSIWKNGGRRDYSYDKHPKTARAVAMTMSGPDRTGFREVGDHGFAIPSLG